MGRSLSAFTLLAGRAAAFEADGFAAGMTEADAATVLRTFGEHVKQIASHPDGAIYYSKPPAMFRVIQICRGSQLLIKSKSPAGGTHSCELWNEKAEP